MLVCSVMQELYVSFARVEEFCQELDRCRAIYKFALDHLPKAQAEELYQDFMTFEKKYGDKDGIEDVVISKKRLQYENDVRANPRNYDTWFDYIRYRLYHALFCIMDRERERVFFLVLLSKIRAIIQVRLHLPQAGRILCY